MTLFDPLKMKEAAWKRFENRAQRGMKESESRREWAKENAAIDALEKVADWLKKYGITLHFERRHGAIYNSETKQVIISSALRPPIAIIYALHECGHILVGFEPFAKRFEYGYPKQNDPRHNRSFQHRLSVLEEEIEAWHRGRKLLERLELNWCVTEEMWEKKKQECITSYLKWSLKPKDFVNT